MGTVAGRFSPALDRPWFGQSRAVRRSLSRRDRTLKPCAGRSSAAIPP
jgi:hypothetical protein